MLLKFYFFDACFDWDLTCFDLRLVSKYILRCKLSKGLASAYFKLVPCALDLWLLWNANSALLIRTSGLDPKLAVIKNILAIITHIHFAIFVVFMRYLCLFRKLNKITKAIFGMSNKWAAVSCSPVGYRLGAG